MTFKNVQEPGKQLLSWSNYTMFVLRPLPILQTLFFGPIFLQFLDIIFYHILLIYEYYISAFLKKQN